MVAHPDPTPYGGDAVTDKKTIRVRIAVAVTPNGCWDTRGMKLTPTWTGESDEKMARLASDFLFERNGTGHVVFVECEVPLPESVTIEGKVQP